MRKLLTVISCGLAFAGTSSAFAANPGTQGQPSQSCEKQTSAPPGFSSGGFANAENHYANSGTATSQYDVACFQVSQQH